MSKETKIIVTESHMGKRKIKDIFAEIIIEKIQEERKDECTQTIKKAV